jgi:hypothetical protein
MSWHPGGRKAMWIEGRRGESMTRIQVARLLDYRPGPQVPVKAFPRVIAYGTADLSVLSSYAMANQNADVKVYGRRTGYILYRRTADGVTQKTYVDFSDDGRNIWSGSERMESNPFGRSTYTARVKQSGAKTGLMDLKITFGPLRGGLPAQIIFDADASGTPLTHGYVDYDGQRLNAEMLAP